MKRRHSALLLFLLALPWQTRWIVEFLTLGGNVTEFGKLALYAFDILLLLALGMSWRVWTKERLTRLWSSTVRRVAVIALAVVVLCSAIGVFGAVAPWAAGVFALRLLLAGVLFVTILLDEELSVDVVLAGVAVGMLIPSLLAWLQSWQQVIPASTVLGIAAQHPKEAGVAVIETATGRWLRAYGSFPHPNLLGGFAAFGLLSAYAVAIRGKMKQSLVLWLAAAVMGGALIMSASRTAWLAFALGVSVLYFGHRYLAKAKQALQRVSNPLFLSGIVMLIVGLSLLPTLGDRMDLSNRLEAQSISERADQWQDARQLIAQGGLPLVLGVGGWNYVFALEDLRPLRDVWNYQPVHNVPMLLLVELGVVGALATLIFIVATDLPAHRRYTTSNGLIALSLGTVVLVLSLADHYLWTQASGLYLLALFFAVNLRLGEEA